MNHKINFPLAIATTFVVGLSAIALVSALQIKPIDSDPTGISNILDEFQQFVQEERLSIDNPNALELDPTKLILAADHDVRLYFINERAESKNQLGFTATDGVNSQQALAFDNISCHISNPECQLPSEDGILNVSDYVELGNLVLRYLLCRTRTKKPAGLCRERIRPNIDPQSTMLISLCRQIQAL